MIKTENLTFSYFKESSKNVLDKINIEIEMGGFVAILGVNGSGKSTLAKHFNAINLPQGGKVYVDKMDTSNDLLTYNIRQTVGMVFQNPDNQIVATVVEDDVAFAPENMGITPEEIRRRVDWAIDAVGMNKYKKVAPHLLSGGQKQRVAIAGILAMQPKYIVLDEPTAMLDPIGRREVINTLKKLNAKLGITVIIITHNMDEAVKAERIVVMDEGKIAMDGIPRDIFADVVKVKNSGLDVPQVTELIYELKKQGYNIDGNALTVDEAYNILKPFVKSGTYKSPYYSNYKKNTEPVIELKNVNFEYSVDGPFYKKALENINLTIYKGDFIALIGHTGSGKSTLLQHLNCLLKPTSGEVIIGGVDVSKKKDNLRDIRTKVGLVFQYPEYQLFEETVIKDISFSPKNMGLSPSEIEERVKYACEVVDIKDEWLDKSPFELSGGQKRRVAIAGILAMKPEILVLDEPTAGLDPRGKKNILDKIKKMHDEYNITIVIVSHDMEEAAKRADRIIVMNEGKIFADSTPQEVFSNYKGLEKIGLTAPQITHLTDRLFGIKTCTVYDAVSLFPPVNGGAGNA
ncbi:MAG: energy-coupling factor transporter ATPase [Clostridia bacterium]|nr:energy-coupling factor transporter ATPase [Clostridia bacterium]